MRSRQKRVFRPRRIIEHRYFAWNPSETEPFRHIGPILLQVKCRDFAAGAYYDQLTAAQLSGLTPQKLNHYNQILREQLAELEAELRNSQAPFREFLVRGWRAPLRTEEVDRQLNADMKQMRQTIRQIEADLIAFGDPEKLRASLDEGELEVEDELDPLENLDELVELMGSMQAPRRGRRR
jgi:hypothetical protein